jgi:hypothetical protein
MKTLLIEGLDLKLCSLRLANFSADEFGENRVHIHTLEAKVKGGGREALKVICKNADDLRIVLSLNACPLRTDLYSTPLDTQVLVKWYESFGFMKRATRAALNLECDPMDEMPYSTSPLWLHMSNLMVRNAR